MPVKIIITKTLEDWWGADDLVSDCLDNPELRDDKLIELCMEDTSALLDGAEWEIEIIPPLTALPPD